MKTLKAIFLLVLCFTVNKVVFSQTFNYLSPKDNSILVSLSTNIILKSDKYIDQSSLTASEFSIIGSVSGIHSGISKLSDDKKTVLFFPATPFAPNEVVSVNVSQGIKTVDDENLPQVAIHFRTTPLTRSAPVDLNTFLQTINESSNSVQQAALFRKSPLKAFSTESLPSDFPGIKVDSSNNPPSGNIFLTNFSLTPNDPVSDYLMILNNDGSVAKYKKLSEMAVDFKIQSNGDLSYSDITQVVGTLVSGKYVVLDTNLTTIDTLQCGNGYLTYPSDFLLLPNGHALIMGMEIDPFDMSQYGGSPNATIVGDVIQELDASKNVVFQWRTLDYIPITDTYVDLTTPSVDLIHANAFDVDQDGNILFSMRHLSSIIKIDRQTGNIDWFLGGKQNQFTFINEHESNAPNYFSFQHDVRLLPNGDITLFDNGNQHSPNYSRGVEYRLNEKDKTATLVWEYRHSPDIYGYAMGSVQRLANGNTLIGWGLGSLAGSPMFTVVHPDNSIALEFSLPPGEASYRVYILPWVSQSPKASVTIGNGTAELLQGNTYQFNSINDTTGITIKFDKLNTTPYPTAVVSKYNYAPITPTFTADAPIIFSNYFNIAGRGIDSYTGEVHVNLYDYPAITDPKDAIVYVRHGVSDGFIPMPTSYDSTKNELTFTTSTLGDFAFGVPQPITAAYAPVPISPMDSAIVNQNTPIQLIWGTRGMVQTYHLQVSTSSLFSSMVVDSAGLSSTSLTMRSVGKNTMYYWRVNNTNTAGTSNWSNAVSFSTAAPFIKILFPNGGEQIQAGSIYVVRWQSNITDSLNIQLIIGSNAVLAIGSGIVSGTNAIQWQVPSTVQPGSNYKVMITSKSNTSISGLSDSPFTISSIVTGVNDITNTLQSYELFQNYPNPFNPATTISFTIPSRSFVSLKIFDELGIEVARLVNGEMSAGNHTQQWNAANMSSGIYFYRLEAGTYIQTRKLLLLK